MASSRKKRKGVRESSGKFPSSQCPLCSGVTSSANFLGRRSSATNTEVVEYPTKIFLLQILQALFEHGFDVIPCLFSPRIHNKGIGQAAQHDPVFREALMPLGSRGTVKCIRL